MAASLSALVWSASSSVLPARRVWLALLVGMLAGGCVRRPPPPPLIYGRPTSTRVVTAPTPAGIWREQWGIPGHTDVDYHDEYRITIDRGRPSAESLNPDRPEDIVRVTINGPRVELVLHTSFDILYRLELDATGDTMHGTATTPEKVIPVRWDRIPRPTVDEGRVRFEDP